jgi:hypothetical protein
MATQDVRAAYDALRDDQIRVQLLLERALNYRNWVRVLHDELDIPDEVLAEIAGVHPGSVRRWRSTDPDVGEPRSTQALAIEWTRRIALVLVSSGVFLELDGVGVWMQAGRKAFDWRSPAELLAEGSEGFNKVLDEAEKFVGPGLGLTSASIPGVDSEALAAAGFGPPRKS